MKYHYEMSDKLQKAVKSGNNAEILHAIDNNAHILFMRFMSFDITPDIREYLNKELSRFIKEINLTYDLYNGVVETVKIEKYDIEFNANSGDIIQYLLMEIIDLCNTETEEGKKLALLKVW